MIINSESSGDFSRFRALGDLRRGLESLPAAPRDFGTVGLVVRRIEHGLRETPVRLRFTPELGVPEDRWGVQANPDPEAQMAVMQIDVARLIAVGQSLELFGDQLFLDLDLSVENLPPGSRVQLGGATVVVTPLPHNGCKKFRARFGLDALQFVSMPELRPRNLRGVYMRVVEAGEVAVGDEVRVLARAGQ